MHDGLARKKFIFIVCKINSITSRDEVETVDGLYKDLKAEQNHASKLTKTQQYRDKNE